MINNLMKTADVLEAMANILPIQKEWEDVKKYIYQVRQARTAGHLRTTQAQAVTRSQASSIYRPFYLFSFQVIGDLIQENR